MIASSTFLVFPLMVGCTVCADELVFLLLGPNWYEAIPFTRIACFTFALWPFHTINLQAINALGRSDIFLILEIIKKSIGLIVLIVAIPLGVWWMMALGAFIAGPLSVIVNSWPNRKLLNYTIGMQLRDVLPALALCGVMAGVILPIAWLPLPGWGKLLLQVPFGALTYFFCAWLFRLAPLCEMARMVGPTLRTRAPTRLQPLVNGILNRFD
jgi:O-antigen/teichoic acid export membrane protein